MGRWEPNARGRLAEAALKLYAEQGFERTTVTEIAEAAGLTERTFFRHFADKREVLFYGTEMTLDLLTRTIAEAPASASPMDAVGAALESFGAFFQEDPERVRRRDAVVSASTELRERELVKLDAFTSAMAGALRERGTPEPAAGLAAEAGMAAFKVAYAHWVAAEPGTAGRAGEQELPRLVRKALTELQELLADRASV
ncbi:TetR/AcrR family transcriptional regulator [Streptomyces cellulosae]|uniref:TetR/AcrR family transcriptional regulator n=1 Tax=Streptomyces cellulosae TaxID=1968 RepID=UPI0004C6C860|nr:TetR/AcrR family transcriptional regulator [Streptomyces cellulosae]